MLNHSKLRRASYLIVAAAVALSLTGCVTINKVADTKAGSSPSVTSADKAYWTRNGSAAAAKVAAGKYVKVPAGTRVGDLKVGTLLDGAFKDLPLAGAFQKVEATDVDGTPAYLLADRLSPQDGQIYVSADGKARLLRIVGVKANRGTLDFTEWDAVPPKSPPPADQLVEIPGLG